MTNPQARTPLGVPQYEWDAMVAYTRACANILQLRDWVLVYDETHPDDVEDGALGSMQSWHTRHRGRMFLPVSWYEASRPDAPLADREEARDTVAHELMHMHMHQLRCAYRWADGHLAPGVQELLEAVRSHEYELLADRLASIVSPLLPLPFLPAAPSVPKCRSAMRPADV